MYSKTKMITMVTGMVTGSFPEVEGQWLRMVTEMPITKTHDDDGLHTLYMCVAVSIGPRA